MTRRNDGHTRFEVKYSIEEVETLVSGGEMEGHLEADIRESVIHKIVGLASEGNDTIDRAAAVVIAGKLYDDVENRRVPRIISGRRLSNKMFRSRLDCHIFFALVNYGWAKSKRLDNGEVVTQASPLSFDQRLGYPTRTRMYTAYRHIRDTCGKERIRRYREAYRTWSESRRRYLATATVESWHWYVRGEGNRNSVAYRTRVDTARRGGIEHFRSRRGFRYMAHELLPRLDEQQRAVAEMAVADNDMAIIREQIFNLMEVPSEYRSLL
jgi:hypothetical protein